MQKRIFEKIKFYIVKRNIIHISCSVWCTFYRNDIKKVLSIFIFENLWNTNPKLNTNNEVAEILFLKCNSNFISKAMYLLLFLFYKLWRVGYKFHKVIDAKIRSTAVSLTGWYDTVIIRCHPAGISLFKYTSLNWFSCLNRWLWTDFTHCSGIFNN